MIFLRRLGINILMNAERVIFISNTYKQQVLNQYIPSDSVESIKEKVEVIPNGVDKYWIEHINHSKTTYKNPIVLLYVGEINRNKNLETSCKAIKYLYDKGIHVSFKIIGKVIEKSILNTISEYPFVNYKGTMLKEQLINEYQTADIFIMPSITETFGLVYVEAMSQGLPVLYTRGQGFDQFFHEGVVGYSVNPTNAIEIAMKIMRI